MILMYIWYCTFGISIAHEQMVFKLPQGHENSEYVLSFEIEHGKMISIAHEQIESQTDGQTYPVPY